MCNCSCANIPFQLISSYLIIYRVAQGRAHESRVRDESVPASNALVVEPVTVTFPPRTVQAAQIESNGKVDGLPNRQ